MASLGLYPVGSRPKATLKRSGAIIVYGVLSAAGIGALAASAKSTATSSAAMAGIGAQSFVLLGQASATMNTSGAGTFSGNLTAKATSVLNAAGAGAMSAPNAITKSSMSLSVSGSGQVDARIFSQNNASMVTTGAGSFAPIIMAKVSGTATLQGMGGMGSSDSPSSAASFQGLGTLSAVGYAFYADAEVATPAQEIRIVYVPYEDRHPAEPAAMVASEPRTTSAPAENRLAVVPFENRVYEVSSKPPVVGPPNRRRRTL